MERFTNREKVDLYDCFILCRRNAERAREMYNERFFERRQPGLVTFSRLRDNLLKYGSFNKPNRNRNSDENLENLVLQSVLENPRTSLRQIEANVEVSKTTAQRVLKKFKYRPYHEHISQGLREGDLDRRSVFCNWFLRKCQESPRFPLKVLWSDESKFTNCGVFNRHNNIYWADENPFRNREVHHQTRWGFNVWIGILNGHVLFNIFNDNLTGPRYLEILENYVDPSLEELPLHDIANMWFQQDGAPAHNSAIISNYLNEQYGDNWIGNRGPVAWPARSPDLTPLDFCVWGYLKDKVYYTNNNTVEELEAAVRQAIQEMPRQIVINACLAMIERCTLCINKNGGLFEHFIN
jgi:hypothetical protein